MSLFIASLNSGSSGNCYYVGNQNEAVLVDAGISCREIEKRMANLELTMDKVKAIFISHEHTDHIKGVDKLARKHHLPVYITPLRNRFDSASTRRHCRKQKRGIDNESHFNNLFFAFNDERKIKQLLWLQKQNFIRNIERV